MILKFSANFFKFSKYIDNLYALNLPDILKIILVQNYFLAYIERIYTVAFSPDGKYLATGSSDNSVNLLNISSKTIYHQFCNIH